MAQPQHGQESSKTRGKQLGATAITLTVTGASTRCTLDSSTKISRAFAHKAFTSDSFRNSQRFSWSICRSKSEFDMVVWGDGKGSTENCWAAVSLHVLSSAV
jgi:hypothetical protein